MPKTPAQILDDPNFLQLPLPERRKVMQSVDPNFAGLPPADQDTVLARAAGRQFERDPEKTAQTLMTPEQRQAFQKTGQIIGQREQQAAAQKEAEDKNDPGILGIAKSMGLNLMTRPLQTTMAERHPWEATKEQAQSTWENLKKRWELSQDARRSFWNRDPLQGLVQALAAGIPFGPAAEEAGEQRAMGHYGTATGMGLGLVLPSLAGMGYEAIRHPSLRPAGGPIPPVKQRAISALEREGVPLSMGQKAQDPYLIEIERGMAGVEGPARQIANDFYTGQRQKLAEGLARSASRTGPAAATAAQSVRQLTGYLDRRVDVLFDSANRQYDALRTEAAAHPVTVQVGTKEVPGPRPEAKFTPEGMPRTVPVEKTFEMPIDLQPFRADVNGIYENILETMPEGQRAYSRGFQVLKEVATSKETHMSALAFDRFLSAMKGFLREGNSELLTKSQGLAKRMITAGEKQLDETFEKFSPDMKKRLQTARGTVTEYHRVDELKSMLPQEPGQAFQQLTASKDAYADRLRDLKKLAPQQIQTVARMWIEGWMEKITEEGGVTRSEGLFRALRDLGPETRQLLFGRQAQELMDMSLGAKMVAGAEGSPTARRTGVWGQFRQWLGNNHRSVVGSFLATVTGGAMLGGHFKEAGWVSAAFGAYEAGSKVFGPAIGRAMQQRQYATYARMLFQPGTPSLVRTVMNSTVGSPAFRMAINALNARAIMAEKQTREDQPADGGGGGRGAVPATPRGGGGVGAPPAPAEAPAPRASATAPGPVKQADLDRITAQVAREEGVPLPLLRAVLKRENPTRDPYAVSSKGAVGLMQLTPQAWTDYGRGGDPYDPLQNVQAGGRYLHYLLNEWKFGNRRVPFALAAYNAGPGAVEKYRGIPPFQETQDYVKAIMPAVTGR